MKTGKVVVLLGVIWLAGCNSSKLSPPQSTVRSYNGTASVGDFVTISIDSSAQTITYQNYTNNETGTVPYGVKDDGSYTITDPNGNLLSAYEVPGFVMVVEAANAGPNRDTDALLTAVDSAPAAISDFAGQSFNMMQFRTRDGGVEAGTVTIESSGNITSRTYDPGAFMWTDAAYFNGGTFTESAIHEDASGSFFTIDEEDGSTSTVFGTQNGLWAVDNNNGAILGLPKAASKNLAPTVAGTYNAIYYKKPDAQMQGQGSSSVEVGTAVEGKASISVSAGGAVTITDSQNNVMASGSLVPVADASYVYDGTANTLPDPCYGLFTFRIATSSLHQEVFVTFQGNAVIFSSFQTALPLVSGGTYTYFYGVGLK